MSDLLMIPPPCRERPHYPRTARQDAASVALPNPLPSLPHAPQCSPCDPLPQQDRGGRI